MTEHPVQIRQFSFPDDYQAVLYLWTHAGSGVHVGRSDSLQEIAKKVARDPDLFLLAETGDRLVGSVLGGYDGRRGLMYHLAVTNEYRRSGVGGLLVNELEQRLRQKGCVRCYLLVTKDNEEALLFYEKRGWGRMDDLYVYGKDLI
jgi:ribosomal protein S18 acetylase RimI-like enzyme